MNHTWQYIYFEGLDAGVAVKVDAGFYDSLPAIFAHWPYRIMAAEQGEVFARVELLEGRYVLSSPYIKKAEPYREPVNAICAIVAEMAWAQLREKPSLLCLHGAAAEFSGRLVVFPATRRAGKSTLSVAMLAAGIKLYTDDFLPVSITKNGMISGVSSGVSPRLRLPVPAQIGDRAKNYLQQRETLSNKQYTYVAPLDTESARFGEAAPLGGVVFLERQDGATASLVPINKAEALKTLIRQNFSRALNAGDILAMLGFLAENLPAYALRYDKAEPAIALLKQQFSTWGEAPKPYHPKSPPASVLDDGPQPYTTYDDISVGQFRQAKGVKVVSTDGQRFLTGRNGQSIHYLNEGAAMIWQILSEPASAAEAVDILLAAFPEQPRVQIEKDVNRSFLDFAGNGLLFRLEGPPLPAVMPQESMAGKT
ncbi:MAG: PqqD family protein [Rhodobacteraceae bacterium]|nr:PqqD family protein [Paracoccaceae bacterium]